MAPQGRLAGPIPCAWDTGPTGTDTPPAQIHGQSALDVHHVACAWRWRGQAL